MKAAYSFSPGIHYESANVRNLLRTAGVEVSEAMCFGIGGGIAAGYQYCPSVPANGAIQGSGGHIVGRVKLMTTNGAWYRDSFDRLGVPFEVRESTGKKAALANLMQGLAEGKPVVAWVTPAGIALSEGWTATICGMYSIVVHEADGVTAAYSDHVSTRRLGMDELIAARERVCSFKNRTMTIGPVSIGEGQWRGAVLAGLRETAGDFVKPRLGTFNLPGLKEGVGLINGQKNKRAWPVVFPGASIFLPMRDIFESIEIGTGGGLFRPLYASFLEEAAGLLGKPDLAGLAGEYRKAGAEWTAFANYVLPDKPFSATKAAMRKLAAGDQSQRARLAGLREEALGKFPWEGPAIRSFLDEAAVRLGALYERESALAKELVRLVL